MASATITTKGQVTIPKVIRDKLMLNAGDKVEFVIIDKREALIRPVSKKVDDVFGMLHKPGQKAVSVEEINEALERESRIIFNEGLRYECIGKVFSQR